MTSVTASPTLLKKIDEFLILSYPHLKSDDEVYYLVEYTPRKLSSYSPANRLILNYKKAPSRKKQTDWTYKQQAIRTAAVLFQRAILQTPDLAARMEETILVPIPPSKAKDSPEYDDRNVQLLKMFAPEGNVCELVLQKESRASLHTPNMSRNPQELEQNYYLANDSLAPREIWLFDDVLTQGTTFRAISDTIKKTYPLCKIVGFFIARTTHAL